MKKVESVTPDETIYKRNTISLTFETELEEKVFITLFMSNKVKSALNKTFEVRLIDNWFDNIINATDSESSLDYCYRLMLRNFEIQLSKKKK